MIHFEGFARFDGGCASAEALQRMAAAVTSRTAAAQQHVIAGGFALACHGQSDLHNNPGARVVAIAGRLDGPNAIEQAVVCGGKRDRAARPGETQGRETRPEQCLRGLRGEYALAIFDQRRNALVLARDVMGTRPLYYAVAGGVVLFGTTIKALLSHGALEARPNDDALADLLAGGDAGYHRETCFKGVMRVLPGAAVTFTVSGVAEWQFDELAAPETLTLGSFEQYADALRPLMKQAVLRRLGSRSAISVSGGFDSSTIYCIAAKAPAKARGDVIGLSLIFDGHGETEEQQFLAALESRAGRIERVNVNNYGLLRTAAQTVAAGETPAISAAGDGQHELYEACLEGGADVLVDGFFGDQLTYANGYWFELFWSGQWTRLRRHVEGFARSFNDTSVRDWLQDSLRLGRNLLVPGAVRPILRRVRNLAEPHRRPAWFSGRMRKLAEQRALGQTSAVAPRGTPQARSLLLAALNGFYRARYEAEYKIASWYGFVPARPFLDRDLLEFVMSVPGEVLNRNGLPRALFRESMRGILPEAIRNRTSKAAFGSVLGRGVLTDAEKALQLLRNGMAVELGYLDRAGIEREAGYLMPQWRAGQLLEPMVRMANVVGLELWLREFFGGARAATDGAARATGAQKSV
ncbi:MAG TPA: asparagine synthase-related protein [Terriglobales bacterium]|nr:asparagine synthase-related protein [Terriglobales bacterium]